MEHFRSVADRRNARQHLPYLRVGNGPALPLILPGGCSGKSRRSSKCMNRAVPGASWCRKCLHLKGMQLKLVSKDGEERRLARCPQSDPATQVFMSATKSFEVGELMHSTIRCMDKPACVFPFFMLVEMEAVEDKHPLIPAIAIGENSSLDAAILFTANDRPNVQLLFPTQTDDHDCLMLIVISKINEGDPIRLHNSHLNPPFESIQVFTKRQQMPEVTPFVTPTVPNATTPVNPNHMHAKKRRPPALHPSHNTRLSSGGTDPAVSRVPSLSTAPPRPCKRAKKSDCSKNKTCEWVVGGGCISADEPTFEFDADMHRDTRLIFMNRAQKLIDWNKKQIDPSYAPTNAPPRQTNMPAPKPQPKKRAPPPAPSDPALRYMLQTFRVRARIKDCGNKTRSRANACLYLSVMAATGSELGTGAILVDGLRDRVALMLDTRERMKPVPDQLKIARIEANRLRDMPDNDEISVLSLILKKRIIVVHRQGPMGEWTNTTYDERGRILPVCVSSLRPGDITILNSDDHFQLIEIY